MCPVDVPEEMARGYPLFFRFAAHTHLPLGRRPDGLLPRSSYNQKLETTTKNNDKDNNYNHLKQKQLLSLVFGFALQHFKMQKAENKAFIMNAAPR